MTTPKEYRQQINGLGLDGHEFVATNTSESKFRLKQCREFQKDLRQIKKSINLEIKIIRNEYREKIANAGSVTGSVFSLFGKRGLAGSIRADAKRGMTRERDNKITPYDEIKLYIDNLIHQLDDAKQRFEEFISENKETDKLVIRQDKGHSQFCTKCGVNVTKLYKYCAQCGNKL